MMKVNVGNLEKELKDLVAEIMECDPTEITPDANFIEDLGMDSMMTLEVISSLEKKYKLRIPEENLAKITNLKSVTELIIKFVRNKD